MSASEMGCGKEEMGKEDMEEERASDLNMNNEETHVEGNHGSVDNQTPADDANINASVDHFHGNDDSICVNANQVSGSKNDGSLVVDSAVPKTEDNASVDVNVNEVPGSKNDGSLVVDSGAPKTEDNVSVDVNANEVPGSKNDGSVVEAAAAKTDNSASVDVNANEASGSKNDGSMVESSAAKTNNSASVDVNVNELSANKNDGSVVNSLNQLEHVAAGERSSEVKAENNEKCVKLDDASAVDVSANELSGRKNGGSHVHLLNQLEGAAANERSSEIKAENDEKGGKLDDTSLVEVSSNILLGSKINGSHAHTLNQLEVAAADERSSEMKVENDEEVEKLDDTSLVDVTSNKLSGSKIDGSHAHLLNQLDHAAADEESSDIKAEDEKWEKLNNGVADMELSPESDIKESKPEVDVDCDISMKSSNLSFLYEPPVAEGDESGTDEEQTAFVKEVGNFYKERSLEFKHPKFYKEDLNLLKLWRAVIKLGGYEEVTSCKLWRQVGESFNPPKTCTTVSWTFRIFYEKALLEYEKHRMNNVDRFLCDVSLPEPSRIDSQASDCHALGSGRARRDAAARAMQGWHSKRLLGSGEVCQPIIKEKNSSCTPKSDRQIKNIGMLKRKKPSSAEHAIQVTNIKATNPQSDTIVIDVGPPADWVKINVQRTSDCFEVYALVPGLLREEVHVQSDPAGRLVISGQPEQLDNPWGVIPFKKVVSLPSRIDPHQTSAVVTLHGQLFVRVPFEQSDL